MIPEILTEGGSRAKVENKRSLFGLSNGKSGGASLVGGWG